MKKFLFVSVFILVTASTAVYFYTYKEHRDIATEKADFSISTSVLQEEFNKNDSLFNAKYADKTIEIYGKTSSADLANQTIIIDKKIVVVFKDSILNTIPLDQEIKVKGRYVGYDDLLEEFKIDQATRVE